MRVRVYMHLARTHAHLYSEEQPEIRWKARESFDLG